MKCWYGNDNNTVYFTNANKCFFTQEIQEETLIPFLTVWKRTRMDEWNMKTQNIITDEKTKITVKLKRMTRWMI